MKQMYNQETLVSIILPTYNGKNYIRTAIESCLNQSYRNIELIIIDDCSIDGTEGVIKEYLAKDKRIRYYKNEANLKLPASLNKGFSLAKGQYFTWTSDDNYYAPTAIEVLKNKMEELQSVDIVYSSYTFIDAGGKMLDTFRYLPELLLFKCTIGACFLYTRKVYDVIGDYDTRKFRMEDYDYWLRASTVFKTYYIDDPKLYFYRKHKDSLSTEIYTNDSLLTEYKENYKKTFVSFLNDYMNGSFSDEHLNIHVKIFFNDLINVDLQNGITAIDIDSMLAYFNKLKLLDWGKTTFNSYLIKNEIDKIEKTILKKIIEHLLFISNDLGKSSSKLTDKYGKSVSWYYKEYEVLPSWYKKIGHLIKVVQGNRSWKSIIKKESEQ